MDASSIVPDVLMNYYFGPATSGHYNAVYRYVSTDIRFFFTTIQQCR